MKYWLLAITLVVLSGWILVRSMQRTVMPGVLRSGTEQILALWRDAMLAYQKDEGRFPPLDGNGEKSSDHLRLDALTGDNKAEKEYLVYSSIRTIIDVIPVDAWETPLHFDPQDASHITSAGPDLTMGTADDIDSRNVKTRNISSTREPKELRNSKAPAKTNKAKSASSANPPASTPSQ